MQGTPMEGFIFNFDNTFNSKPADFDFIRVWQIGEFSIEHDREIQAHRQGCHEITYVIAGKGTFYSNGVPMKLQPGDVHMIAKGVEHRIVPAERSNLRFANIGFEFSDKLPEEFRPVRKMFEEHKFLKLEDKGEIRLLITQLINEMYAKTAQSHLMAECYIKLILAHTFRLTETEKPKMFSPKKSPAARLSLYTIIRYVDDNFMDFPGIDEMAKTLGYSASYISHVFKEKMGLTLQEYIGKKKIEASLDFLKYQKYTITQIAMMLNYASVQSFGKAFRKAMGCSPTEYQRLHGSEKGNEDGDTGR